MYNIYMEVDYNIEFSSTDFENVLDCLRRNQTKFVDICYYKIIRDAKFPFLLFVLRRTSCNLVDFVRIHNVSIESTLSLQNTILSFIDTSVNIAHLCPIRYVHSENKIFIDVTDVINHKLLDNTKWVIGIAHEITNQHHVCNAKTSSNLNDFVTMYPDCMMLRDQTQQLIEMPSIAYKQTPERSSIDYLFTFGVTKSLCNGKDIGAYYFFETARDSNELTIFVKFAVFMGITFHIYNTERLEWCIANKHLWTKHYSSIFIKESNSTKNTIVLKEYDQQYPL
jgi:hypothetical protein